MSDACIGEIRMFAGPYAPEGWRFCDGSMVRVPDYMALYSLIGKTYGSDSNITFALPDLRGRLPVGKGQLENGGYYSVGELGGSETVTLFAANTPVHMHGFNATNADANTNEPNQALPAVVSPVGSVSGLYAKTTGGDVVAAPMDSNFLDFSSGSQPSTAPHANMMPSFGVTFIICTAGLYPQRP